MNAPTVDDEIRKFSEQCEALGLGAADLVEREMRSLMFRAQPPDPTTLVEKLRESMATAKATASVARKFVAHNRAQRRAERAKKRKKGRAA